MGVAEGHAWNKVGPMLTLHASLEAGVLLMSWAGSFDFQDSNRTHRLPSRSFVEAGISRV